MPHDELEAKTSSLAQEKTTPIVAVCDNGISSTRSVNLLRKQGFESVYGLKGGMNGWTQAGLPVVTGKKTKSKTASQVRARSGARHRSYLLYLREQEPTWQSRNRPLRKHWPSARFT